jgi:hypothetical protein
LGVSGVPSDDLGKLGASIFDATVDLNPHQLDAALFAFRSPLSRGAILAYEVVLGKTHPRHQYAAKVNLSADCRSLIDTIDDTIPLTGESAEALEGAKKLAENCAFLLLSKGINHSLAMYSLIEGQSAFINLLYGVICTGMCRAGLISLAVFNEDLLSEFGEKFNSIEARIAAAMKNP